MRSFLSTGIGGGWVQRRHLEQKGGLIYAGATEPKKPKHQWTGAEMLYWGRVLSGSILWYPVYYVPKKP